MCDCGCTTPVEDTYGDNSYQPTTYDITGNPIDDPGYQVPFDRAPVEMAPVEVAPAPQPVLTDPTLSTNDQLLNSLNTLPAGSPVADTITSVLLQPGKDAAVWFQPTHDIYGNSL